MEWHTLHAYKQLHTVTCFIGSLCSDLARLVKQLQLQLRSNVKPIIFNRSRDQLPHIFFSSLPAGNRCRQIRCQGTKKWKKRFPKFFRKVTGTNFFWRQLLCIQFCKISPMVSTLASGSSCPGFDSQHTQNIFRAKNCQCSWGQSTVLLRRTVAWKCWLN